MRRLPSRGPPAAAHDRGDFAARDRDSSNWTAWWSKLNSNFSSVCRPRCARPWPAKKISARRLRNRGDSIAHAEMVVYTRRKSKPTPLLVPVPGQLFHDAAHAEPRRPASLQQRLDQIRARKAARITWLTWRSLLPADCAIARSEATSPRSHCSNQRWPWASTSIRAWSSCTAVALVSWGVTTKRTERPRRSIRASILSSMRSSSAGSAELSENR